jgi:hypothetical protein
MKPRQSSRLRCDLALRWSLKLQPALLFSPLTRFFIWGEPALKGHDFSRAK